MGMHKVIGNLNYSNPMQKRGQRRPVSHWTWQRTLIDQLLNIVSYTSISRHNKRIYLKYRTDCKSFNNTAMLIPNMLISYFYVLYRNGYFIKYIRYIETLYISKAK